MRSERVKEAVCRSHTLHQSSSQLRSSLVHSEATSASLPCTAHSTRLQLNVDVCLAADDGRHHSHTGHTCTALTDATAASGTRSPCERCVSERVRGGLLQRLPAPTQSLHPIAPTPHASHTQQHPSRSPRPPPRPRTHQRVKVDFAVSLHHAKPDESTGEADDASECVR